MDSLISTFHLDLKLMIAQVVNFAVVFIVLYIFALKPLKKVMDERNKTISGGLENAKLQEQLVEEAKKLVEEGKVKLNQMAMEEKKALAKEIEKKKEEARVEAEEYKREMLEKTRSEMKAEKEKILKDAEKEVANIVLAIAEKTFGDAMDEKTRAKIVASNIKDIK